MARETRPICPVRYFLINPPQRFINKETSRQQENDTVGYFVINSPQHSYSVVVCQYGNVAMWEYGRMAVWEPGALQQINVYLRPPLADRRCVIRENTQIPPNHQTSSAINRRKNNKEHQLFFLFQQNAVDITYS